ncbi:MAG: leucine-rich repeat domain-containing protein [Bacteroidales bacterium]|nr:leucine-rich repeat domain-containing protein [Bacteroidales bacterium]
MNLRWRWLLGLSFMCGLGVSGSEAQVQAVLSRSVWDNMTVEASASVVAAAQQPAVAQRPAVKAAPYRLASKSAQCDTVRLTVSWSPADLTAEYPFVLFLSGDENATGVIEWGDGEQSSCSVTKNEEGKEDWGSFRHAYAEKGDYEVIAYTTSTDLHIIGVNTNRYSNYEEGATLATSLDVRSNPSLKYLNCYGNRLGTLDVSQNAALEELFCHYCNLSSLDVTQNTAMTYLYCYNNNLTSLDVTRNTALLWLLCANNQLETLDVSQNTALDVFECSVNRLTDLDVSPNTALTGLYCWGNQLTALDISANEALEVVSCSLNLLNSLNIGQHTAFKIFEANYNRLGWASLDTLSKLQGEITISPQVISEQLAVNDVVDLSGYQTYKEEKTVFDFSELPASGYAFSRGRLQIKRPGSYTVPMYNPAVKQGDDTVYINCYLSVWPKVSDTVRWVWTAEAGKSYDCSLALSGDSTFWVQWGDGEETEVTLDALINGWQYRDPSHVYERAGDYEVKVYGATSHCVVLELGLNNRAVSSLDVSACPLLTTLSCSNNQLTALDLSNNTALTYLACYYNQLTALDVTNNTDLTHLYCSDNQLAALDVKNNTALTGLDCSNNQLTALDVANSTALTFLSCSNNRLTALNVTKNTDLTSLSCFHNQLSSLDVKNNTALTRLDCSNNQLTALDVKNNTALTYLDCSDNQLSALDVKNNTALTHLNCSYNQLAALDVAQNTALENLSCHHNRLPSLDVSKNEALTLLYCSDNRLTSLDVSANVALTHFECGYNRLTSLDLCMLNALQYVHCSGNTLEVTLDERNAYDLSTLPGMDVTKITSVNGGILDEDDETHLIFGMNVVYYNYEIGWDDRVEQFMLIAAKEDDVQIPLTAEFFPDDIFRAYLAGFDKDGNDSLGEYERILVGEIDVRGSENWSRGIKRLDGLQYFENLVSLYCGYNDLTTLDVSKNKGLNYLYCNDNRMPLSAIAGIQADARSLELMICTPQRIPVTLELEQTLDLKSEMQFKGMATDVDFGTVSSSDYTFKSGKLQFKKAGTYRVLLTNDSVKSTRREWISTEDGYEQVFIEDTVKVFYDITVKPASVVPDDPDDPDKPNRPGDDDDDPDKPSRPGDDDDDPDKPGTPSEPSANESALAAAPFAYVQGHTVYLTDGLGEVEAFTAVGQRVYRGRECAITLPRTGIYVLRVVADGRRCKIIVR